MKKVTFSDIEVGKYYYIHKKVNYTPAPWSITRYYIIEVESIVELEAGYAVYGKHCLIEGTKLISIVKNVLLIEKDAEIREVSYNPISYYTELSRMEDKVDRLVSRIDTLQNNYEKYLTGRVLRTIMLLLVFLLSLYAIISK